MRLSVRIVAASKKLTGLLVGWIVASCLSPINIDINTDAQKVVVTGQVSTLPDRTFVYVGETVGTDRLPRGVQDAFVQLIDEHDNAYQFTEVVDGRNQGNYALPGFAATPGTSYFVRVSFARGVFESTPERVPLSGGQDDLSYEFTEQTEMDAEGVPFNNRTVLVYTQPTIPPDAFVKWDLQEVYIIVPTDFPDPFGVIPPSCYVSQGADPQRVVIAQGATFDGSVSGRLLLGARVADQSFSTRHYFISYMGSTTKEAHDYWRKVNILANQVGSIFDTPPSPITGNIHDADNTEQEMLGYFQAVNESMARFSIAQNELPFTLQPYCIYNPDWARSRYAPECLDCIKARNASYERPVWFGE